MPSARKKKSHHVGGFQDPLFTPASDWKPPKELPDLRGCQYVALDRETNDRGLRDGRGPGWAYRAGKVIGVSAAWREGSKVKSFYAPLAHPDSVCIDPDKVKQWEIDHARAGVTFVMHNAPYDVGWGDADLGVPPPPKVDDTSCMAYMIDESRMSFTLDSLCAWRNLEGKNKKTLNEAAAAFGVNAIEEMWRLPARYVGEYAEQDAVSTLLLAERLRPELAKEELEKAYQLEMDLLPMVHAMRKRGIRINLDAAEVAKASLLKTADQMFADMSDRLGQTVTMDEVRRAEWLERVFDGLKIKYPRARKTDRGSFESKWMKTVDHWLPQMIAKAKSYHEAGNKFVQTYILDFAHNGRLHASINQFKSEDGGTRTYRFSYADPPLQQMPHRNEELASVIRGLFLPEEGEAWQSCDYSQQEYRLIVHYAEKNKLPKASDAGDRYRSDPKTDFHNMVAEMTGLARKPAKDTNFAKAYGAGKRKFAIMIGKSEEEAAAIMDQYDRQLPFVKMLYDKCHKRAKDAGYIRLLDGARIHFNFWVGTWRVEGESWSKENYMADCRLEEAERRQADPEHPWYGKALRRSRCNKAMNSLIQGGAARQTKLAMRACWQEGYIPLIQMHDELGFSQSNSKDGERIAEIMRDVVQLTVPMVVDAEYGPSWGQATEAVLTPKKS